MKTLTPAWMRGASTIPNPGYGVLQESSLSLAREPAREPRAGPGTSREDHPDRPRYGPRDRRGGRSHLAYYDRAKVERFYALEPNPGMVRLAATRRAQVSLDIEFLTQPAECIPLEDGSVDTVVSTFTLCTIPAVDQALSSIARVLRPDGLLVFLENSLASDPDVQRWQRRWTPIHRRVFQGLVLTRDIPALVDRAGFHVERLERGCLGRFPRSWSHCCWGTARKAILAESVRACSPRCP